MSNPSNPPPSYVNFIQIRHSPTEFYLDLVKLHPPLVKEVSPQPGQLSGSVEGRFMMSPAHAKSLLRALKTNIEAYEKTFGKIPDSPVPIPENVTYN